MTIYRHRWLLALILSCISLPVFAEEDPLTQTQNLLNDRDQRNALIAKDPNAKHADDQVKALGLDASGQDQVYQLSGKMMETLSKDTGGDADKMMEKVQGYMRNPASLEQDLTPEERAKVEELSRQAKPSQ